MSCHLTEQWFRRWVEHRDYPISAELEEHLKDCPGCRKTLQLLLDPVVPPETGGSLLPGLREKLLRDLFAVAPLPPRRNLMAAITFPVALGTAGYISWLGTRGSSSLGITQMGVLGLSSMLSLVILSDCLCALMEPGSKTKLPLPFAIGAALIFVLISYSVIFPWSTFPPDALAGWKCGRVIVIGFLPVLGVLVFSMRKGYFTRPVWAAIAGTATAALAPLGALQFSCPAHDAVHLAIWHWGVWLITAGFGALSVFLYRALRRKR